MSIPTLVIDMISKVTPGIGALLGGPVGGVVGSLVSSVLGVDMKNADEVHKMLKDNPDCINDLKKLELQLQELQNARDAAAKETGIMRYMRPMLVILAFLALFTDLALLAYVDNTLIREALLVFTGILILDIRQIYKLYFGSWQDNISILPNLFKKK
jgi:hypothetical protein